MAGRGAESEAEAVSRLQGRLTGVTAGSTSSPEQHAGQSELAGEETAESTHTPARRPELWGLW